MLLEGLEPLGGPECVQSVNISCGLYHEFQTGSIGWPSCTSSSVDVGTKVHRLARIGARLDGVMQASGRDDIAGRNEDADASGS